MEGTLSYKSGETYVGTFKNGQKECGVQTYLNGDQFSGEFRDSARYMGVMKYKGSSQVYKGEFNADGQYHGSGSLLNEAGDKYSGEF